MVSGRVYIAGKFASAFSVAEQSEVAGNLLTYSMVILHFYVCGVLC